MIISIDVTFKVATNNDTESYSLYGDSPSPKAQNQEAPGADNKVKKDDGAKKTASNITQDKKAVTTDEIIKSTAVSPTPSVTNTKRKIIGG